jgi:hypothetical protein
VGELAARVRPDVRERRSPAADDEARSAVEVKRRLDESRERLKRERPPDPDLD